MTSENTIFVRFYFTVNLMLTNTKSQNKYYLGEITKSSMSRAARVFFHVGQAEHILLTARRKTL